ncbi:MAG: pantetheine-phosphate adenylyltransferase [Spirochaetales bacterium]|nr:pantetheine-phosphate adenylyltransferase [Spirochaetales bacterium]
MSSAIYAFSGDPITFGHIDIITRASRVFDELIVGIGVNPKKKYMFSLEERKELASKSLSGLSNVRVVAFEGLLVDYAFENNITVIIKGLRNASDFDYEVILHQMSESQKLSIDTFFLPAKQDMTHISSSSVKALQLEQGLIHKFVPLYVKQCLEAKISGQYMVGVTGEIGAGKSYVSNRLSGIGAKRKIPVHNIELDHIGHKILGELSEPLYREIREQIAREFGGQIRNKDGTISRKALGEIVFNDQSKLDELNRILATPLLVRLRRELYTKKGIILINAALIAESNMAYICNNNVVLVTVKKEDQKARLLKRDLTDKQVEKRLQSQYNAEQKREKVNQAIEAENHGRLWIQDNSDNTKQEDYEKLLDEILVNVDIYGELRFKALWQRIGGMTSCDEEYDGLITAYSEQHRSYHVLTHIIDGLNLIAGVRHLLKYPDALECAYFYHDIIYNPRSSHNEENSAVYARKHLLDAEVKEEFADRVADFILQTMHRHPPKDDDSKYLVDVDLSILGSERPDFERYERAIRREYAHIPDEQFNSSRGKFLKELLERKSLFATGYFKDMFEKKARINIRESLGKLDAGKQK